LPGYAKQGVFKSVIYWVMDVSNTSEMVCQTWALLYVMHPVINMPEVERFIRTIKKMVRAIASSLPFKKYPPSLIVEMVYNFVFWLNSFPHKDSIHPTISLRIPLTGLAIDYKKHCKILFGTYIKCTRWALLS